MKACRARSSRASVRGRRSAPRSPFATASPIWPLAPPQASGGIARVDQQDQWQLGFFLGHILFGLDLQAAIDAPVFHTNHFPSSFYPRQARSRQIEVEARFAPDVISRLRAQGHDVVVNEPWSLGRVSAVGREPGGVLKAAANPRGMQGYAVGR